MKNYSNSRAANHIHFAYNPTNRPCAMEVSRDKTRLLLSRVKRHNIKYLILEDYLGPNNYQFYMNLLQQEQSSLLGDGYEAVAFPEEGRHKKAVAIYFRGEHVVDLIPMAETNTDLGQIVFVSAERPVLPRIDFEGKPTLALYSYDNGRKIPNSPRKFEELYGENEDCLCRWLPHPAYWKGGILRQENLKNEDKSKRLEFIIDEIMKGNLRLEIFNGAAAWDLSQKPLETIHYLFGGKPLKGLVGDDDSFGSIGKNTIDLWIPNEEFTDLEKSGSPVRDLELRRNNAGAALRNGHYTIESLRMISFAEFLKKAGRSALWTGRHKLKMVPE